MNYKNFKSAIAYMFALALIFSVSSCTDDDMFTAVDGTEVTFSEFGVNFEQKGALVVISDVQTGFYNFADPNNASIGFTVDDFGADASNINIFKSLNGGTPVMHSSVTSFPSTLTVSLADAANGLTDLASVELLDQFTFTFDIATPDGTFPSGESLAIDVSCVSDLGGEYTAVTVGQSTDGCCPGTVETGGPVTLTDLGGGEYTISDWSGNIYFTWYEIYGVTAAYVADGGVSTTIKDVCDVISAEFTEPFGTATTLTGSVEPSTGVITLSWVTGYADAATVVLTPN